MRICRVDVYEAAAFSRYSIGERPVLFFLETAAVAKANILFHRVVSLFARCWAH
jgi:hypothetical protein